MYPTTKLSSDSIKELNKLPILSRKSNSEASLWVSFLIDTSTLHYMSDPRYLLSITVEVFDGRVSSLNMRRGHP